MYNQFYVILRDNLSTILFQVCVNYLQINNFAVEVASNPLIGDFILTIIAELKPVKCEENYHIINSLKSDPDLLTIETVEPE